MSEWIDEYAASHQNPVNRMCHLLGIPLITATFPLLLLIAIRPDLWVIPAATFGLGWALQFIGHAFEGKPPEFLRDWRFLLVGFNWWLRKTGLRK